MIERKTIFLDTTFPSLEAEEQEGIGEGLVQGDGEQKREINNYITIKWNGNYVTAFSLFKNRHQILLRLFYPPTWLAKWMRSLSACSICREYHREMIHSTNPYQVGRRRAMRIDMRKEEGMRRDMRKKEGSGKRHDWIENKSVCSSCPLDPSDWMRENECIKNTHGTHFTIYLSIPFSLKTEWMMNPFINC